MGRVVGDGFLYFYVQDVIVASSHQGKGAGLMIMEEIMSYLDRAAPLKSGAFVGLMAAEGLDVFYSKFGFEIFPKQIPVMRIWRNGH